MIHVLICTAGEFPCPAVVPVETMMSNTAAIDSFQQRVSSVFGAIDDHRQRTESWQLNQSLVCCHSS